jgi:hypothetical protein
LDFAIIFGAKTKPVKTVTLLVHNVHKVSFTQMKFFDVHIVLKGPILGEKWAKNIQNFLSLDYRDDLEFNCLGTPESYDWSCHLRMPHLQVNQNFGSKIKIS